MFNRLAFISQQVYFRRSLFDGFYLWRSQILRLSGGDFRQIW
ncbi:MAG: hypothetical protein ACK5RE_02190 [Pseudanabaena sp.]